MRTVLCVMPGCDTTAGCLCGMKGLRYEASNLPHAETRREKIDRLHREISQRQMELYLLVAGDLMGGVGFAAPNLGFAHAPTS